MIANVRMNALDQQTQFVSTLHQHIFAKEDDKKGQTSTVANNISSQYRGMIQKTLFLRKIFHCLTTLMDHFE